MTSGYQGSCLLFLCVIGLSVSAPRANPNCQGDGSAEPVCDGLTIFFSHETDCGKFWECGPDFKPCLFECPAISEDIGGGTLFFNIELTTCDWPQNVECSKPEPTNAPTDPTTEATTEEGTTEAPTDAPTPAPTEAPTAAPTEAPTAAPTEAPTASPTDASTDAPTDAPTYAPTAAPTDTPTEVPTAAPTAAPTDAPTVPPTDEPTEAPTGAPTEGPTGAQTDAPTDSPTEAPMESTTLESFWYGECFVDTTERLLGDMMKDFPETNTPEMCIETCLGEGFAFAGVQHKSQCFCGNIPPPESALATEAQECDRTCPGDETQMCGSSWRMNIYDINQ